MRIETLEITWTDRTGVEHTDTVSVRRFKYRETAAIVSILRRDNPTGEADAITMENGAEYQVTLIAKSIVDPDGKPMFSVDDVDEWDATKIVAYAKALDSFQNPTPESVAKNSSATTTEES